MNKILLKKFLLACIVLQFGVVMPVGAVSTNDLSMQSSSRMWNLVNNKSSDEKVQDRYSQINSTSYPIPHSNTDITRLNLKNKSLSVSIPIQCKKQTGDNSQNEEKRAIKASGYKN